MNVEDLFKKIPHYEGVHRLPAKGGTIKTARFEKPRLMEYETVMPFDTGDMPIRASIKKSDRDDMIHCGVATHFYFRIMEDVLSGKPLGRRVLRGNRFRLLLEHQCIIGLASTFEAFIKSVVSDVEGFMRVPHTFAAIEKLLQKKGIIVRELGDLRNKKNYGRMIQIVDYMFFVRNLCVHNGGIVDDSFRKHYKKNLKMKAVGKLIRIDHKDIYTMRSWVSYLVQEICKRVPRYDKVWQDYVLSVGIIVMRGLRARPVFINGSEGPDFEMEERG